MSDYRDEIIDHYKNPRNFGEMENPDLTLTEANSSCGDLIKISLRMDGDKIKEMKWQGVGCAISTAASSMLSEKVEGMSGEDLERMGEGGVIEMLGGEVNPGRMKCAMLAFRGLQKMLKNE